MKFITPIYFGTKGHVPTLNKFLEFVGIENKVPLDADLNALAFYDENDVVTIELFHENRFGELETYIVKEIDGVYHYVSHSID